jgi:hypothetical protein
MSKGDLRAFGEVVLLLNFLPRESQMIRGLALTASFLLASAVPALAQTHPGSHAWPHAHSQSGHVPLDSARHAAMHALLLGSWRGTFSSPQGLSSGLEMSIAHDSLRNVTLRMSTDQPNRAGAASNVVIDGGRLHWTQDLSGASCKATAVLNAPTPLVPNTMEGKMTCEDREMTFTLRRKTG